jgi:acyl carrier protein
VGVAVLFQEVLGHDVDDATASFFELGGHSLLATQLVSRLRRAFEIELPLRAIFEAQTVADLAMLVREAQTGATHQLPPIEVSEELVLSPGQERLWFIQELEPESVAYNMSAAFVLRGDLDAGAFDRALHPR